MSAHRVAVMYLGRIVELADRDALFARPMHPYSEALIAAAPVPDPRRQAVCTRCWRARCRARSIRPPAARFHPRCPLAVARCRVETPALVRLADGRTVACHVRAPQEHAHAA